MSGKWAVGTKVFTIHGAVSMGILFVVRLGPFVGLWRVAGCKWTRRQERHERALTLVGREHAPGVSFAEDRKYGEIR